MNVVLPKPIRQSKETVTLNRSDWEELIERLEDAEDIAAIAARRTLETTMGKDIARRNYLTGDELRRLLDWENPVRVWRDKRGLSQRALAAKAGVSPSYLAEIETDQKPGSADALLKLARVLEVPMDCLIRTNRLWIARDHLKQLVEARVSDDDAITEGRSIVSVLASHGVAGADLENLKGLLRTLAADFHKAGKHDEHATVRAIIRHCFT
jgi:transcriptional regulator with XRE-family HTH domain